MQQHDENVVSPIPWFGEEQDGTALIIRDKNGQRVVETDSGFYPPNLATSKFIVACVNSISELLTQVCPIMRKDDLCINSNTQCKYKDICPKCRIFDSSRQIH